MKMSIFLLFFIICCSHSNESNAQMTYDGVYVVQSDGNAIKLVPSLAKRGHYVTRFFGSFWKFPKKYFTLESNITAISSFKKLVLKGATYDAQTFKNLQLLEMEHIELGMPFFHSGGDKMWQNGFAYKQNEKGLWLWKDLKRNTVSNFIKEAEIDSKLEKGKVYTFWVNEEYYLFEVK